MPDPTFLTRDGGDPVAHFESLVGRFLHPPEESLMTAGLVIREQIRERALAGRSFTGVPFAAYSPSYEARKGQSNVDLFSRNMEPHMLDLLDVRVDSDGIEIGIFNNEQAALRAQVNQEGGKIRTTAGHVKGKHTSLRARRAAVALGKSLYSRVPPRPWLGVTAGDLDRAGALIVQEIGRV